MTNELTQRFPWDPPAVRTTEETVEALQKDFAYAVGFTGVMVRSNRTELRTVVNTQRGQIIPRGASKFTDGSTVEFQDLGMPQPGVRTMTVQELVAWTLETAHGLGLELAP